MFKKIYKGPGFYCEIEVSKAEALADIRNALDGIPACVSEPKQEVVETKKSECEPP